MKLPCFQETFRKAKTCKQSASSNADEGVHKNLFPKLGFFKVDLISTFKLTDFDANVQKKTTVAVEQLL